MSQLTQAQKGKYVNEARGGCCPFCGSHSIAGEEWDCNAGESWQNVSCDDCSETWRDVYTLKYVETDDDNDVCTCYTRSWYGPEHDTACPLEGLRHDPFVVALARGEHDVG